VKAIGYARVSTEDQATEGLSLAAQQQRIRAYCKAHGLNLAGVEVDEGISASRPLAKRPAGARLLNQLQDGQAVVAVKLDRLFRDAGDCLGTLCRTKDGAHPPLAICKQHILKGHL